MNLDRVQGRLRRWVGVFEQGWGRLIGDETLRKRRSLNTAAGMVAACAAAARVEGEEERARAPMRGS